MKRLAIVAAAGVLALGVAGTADAKHKAGTHCAKKAKRCHKHQKPGMKGGLGAVAFSPIDCVGEPNCPAPPGYPTS